MPPTVYEAILAVERGEADRALVPFENSIEGSVRATLDTLAFDADGGDDRRRVRLRGPSLPDRRAASSPGGGDRRSLSHPQPLAQCARFIREQLPAAQRRGRCSSTAEAVREVGGSEQPWAALGHAARRRELYGCGVLRDGVEDEPDNVTRFVWIAPAGTEPERRRARGRRRWSSPSWARTTPAPWSRRCSSSPAAR